MFYMFYSSLRLDGAQIEIVHFVIPGHHNVEWCSSSFYLNGPFISWHKLMLRSSKRKRKSNIVKEIIYNTYIIFQYINVYNIQNMYVFLVHKVFYCLLAVSMAVHFVNTMHFVNTIETRCNLCIRPLLFHAIWAQYGQHPAIPNPQRIYITKKGTLCLKP